MSIWSANALNANGDTLNDVRVAGFPGSGTCLYTCDEYVQIAVDAVRDVGGVFQIHIDWEPNNVPPSLKRWAYAHAELNADLTSQPARRTFRQYLSLKSHRVVPPQH